MAATQAPDDVVTTAQGLVAERRFEPAIECLDRALASYPDQADWREYRGDLLQIVSRHEEALADFERVRQQTPATARIWQKIANSLRYLGRLEQAEQAFHEALRLEPGSLESMANLGNLHRDAGRPGEAVVWLTRAVAAAPADSNLRSAQGAALLAADEPGRARETLEQAFQLNPYDRSTLAYLYAALCRTSALDAALALTAPERLVRSFQRPGSAGAAGDPDGLDHALAEHVRRHPTLEFERYGNTTRGGAHTGNLLDDDAGPVRELLAWIEDRVRVYLDDLPPQQGHPFLAWKPSAWDVDMWGIVMGSGGYQEPHIHRDGWVSGVYYVAVPATVRSGAEGVEDGCLSLGRPPDSLCGTTDFPERVLRPRPGRLHLFPSYLWHRTLPYAEDSERICIAFDIRPRV